MTRTLNSKPALVNYKPVVYSHFEVEPGFRYMLTADPWGYLRVYLAEEAASRRPKARWKNAQAFLAVQEEFGSFDAFIWSFVGGTPIQNTWKNIKEIPATTPESDKMSRELKKRGFKFTGSTICYAFMQAVGMVNDHTVDCFRYKELSGNK